jgi:hypothetical protein
VTETNVFQLSQPGTFADPLTEVLRNGARALLSQAVEAEVAALLSDLAALRAPGCLSNKTALAMIFKLAEAAERSWRRLDGHNQLPKVILRVKFTDGIEVAEMKPTGAIRTPACATGR